MPCQFKINLGKECKQELVTWSKTENGLRRVEGRCVWHRAPDCAGGRVGPWSPPSLPGKLPACYSCACTTIELLLGLAENHHHATTDRAGVYILSGKEKHAPMTIREGLEHAGPVSPILFAPSDRAAARVREASWQTFAGHDGTLGYYGRVRRPDYDQRVHIVFCK